MILYALACEDGHRFDSWFRDSAAYEDQAGAGHVTCPICRSARVAKAIMAPAVVGGRRLAAPSEMRPPSQPEAAEPVRPVALLDESGREVRSLVRAFRDKLLAEGFDVGRRFAKEARRIHDGEVPARQIYGQASIDEARDLLEDGILVLPLPTVPDELN